MNFEEYQELAQETAIYPRKGDNIEYPTLEKLQTKLKKFQGITMVF